MAKPGMELKQERVLVIDHHPFSMFPVKGQNHEKPHF